MRLIVRLVFVSICIVAIGYSCGIYRRQIAIQGVETVRLFHPLGCIFTLDGLPVAWNGRAIGNSRQLVYCLVIFPDTPRSAGLRNFGTTRRGVYLECFHPEESPQSVVQIAWDPYRDTVVIGNTDYSRADGNVFVAIWTEKSQVQSFQIGHLTDGDEMAALQYIKKHRPNERAVQDAKLSGRASAVDDKW